MEKSKLHKISIEKANLSDLKQIIDLYKQLNEENNLENINKFLLDFYFKDILSCKYFYLLVLKVGDKIISTCLFTIIPNLSQGLRPNGIVESFITDKDNRRKGYGKKLLEYVLSLAEDFECVKVSLLTKNNNEFIKIYENLGFKENLRRSFVYMK